MNKIKRKVHSKLSSKKREKMGKKEQIENEVQKTLQSFDQKETIECSPFFYTRLQDKIRRLEEKKRFSARQIFSRRVLLPAFVVFIVLFNILSLALVSRKSASQSDIRKEYISELAEEYAMSLSEYNLYFR